jgi:hypothetical protein
VTGQRDDDERLTVKVTPAVHRELLTLQYHRKMAGEQVSMSDIIKQLLAERKAATP